MATPYTEIQWKGRTGPFPLLLGPGVFSPTTTSRSLADAMEIEPGDTVIEVDLSHRAVEAARENAKRLGLEHVCEFREGDLLEPVRDVQARVLIGDVSGIPDDIAAQSGWFDEVPSGGPTGAELPTKFVRSIGDTLAYGGRLYLPTGTIQYEQPILDAAHEVFGDNMRPVLTREFPLPELVARSKAVTQMVKDGLVSFRQRGSRWLWQLRIWRCDRA